MTTPINVLVVDDEPDFVEFVRAVAAGLGHSVRTAGGARDMKTLVGQLMPGIIVLDVVMPEADGIELTRWLIDCGYTGRLVIITGYNPLYAEAARVIGEAQGRFEVSVLAKPIALAALREVLSPAATPR